MAKDPAFLFYYQDFLVGTEFMEASEIGCYIRILCHLADKGRLSEKHMQSICKGQAFEGDLKSKFQVDSEGFYFNQRLLDEVTKRKAFTQSRRDNATKFKKSAKAYAEHMENVNESKDENISKKKQPLKTYDFESVWLKHPHKIGKKEALGYFNTTVKTDQNFEDINEAVDNFTKYVTVNKTEKRFVKTGGNWFYEWEDWVGYIVEDPGPEPAKFKFHEVKDSIEKQLCKIATDNMVEKCMRGIPSNAWYMVKAYLKRRYPDGGEKGYYMIEDKLSKERK